MTRVVVLFALLASSGLLEAAELKKETVQEWDRYVAKVRSEIAASRPFLGTYARPEVIREMRAGEIVVEPVGRNPRPVIGGLIHHWSGAAFLPNSTVDAVFSVVRDYGRYKDFYAPLVIDSRALERDGDEYRFGMRMVSQALFSRSALEGEYAEQFHRAGDTRWYSVARSTRIQQIDDIGRRDERLLPPDEGSGYIWRVFSVSRYEQRDGGVYIEVEFIALSRDIPLSLRWLVSPIVRRVSRSTLLTSLEKTRAAVANEADPDRQGGPPFAAAAVRQN